MVTVYSKPQCVQCDATYRAFEKKGLREGFEYQVIDLTADAAAFEMVRALGYQQAPVVVTETAHWAGFRPDMIAKTAKALAPALV